MSDRIHPDDIQAIAERVVSLLGRGVPSIAPVRVIDGNTPLSEVPATPEEKLALALRMPSLMRQAAEQRIASAERKARKLARRAA